MTRMEILGRTLSAFLTAAAFGGLMTLLLLHTLPSVDDPQLPLSPTLIVGGICAAMVGLFIGWVFAVRIAGNIVTEILGRLLAGAVGALLKAL